MGEPILIECEGSDSPPNPLGLCCAMCGAPTNIVDYMPPHQRMDLLAMIDRGDFDG